MQHVKAVGRCSFGAPVVVFWDFSCGSAMALDNINQISEKTRVEVVEFCGGGGGGVRVSSRGVLEYLVNLQRFALQKEYRRYSLILAR